MRYVSNFLLIFFLASIAFAQQQPSADDITRRAVDILGGSDAMQRARYFSFTFQLEKDGKVVDSFPQKWDRFTGEYEVSGRRPDGLPFDVTINLKTKRGHGSIPSRPVTNNTEFQKLYELAYSRFINDTFWLLMPLRMVDPGAHRTYDGERTDTCGHTWDLVKVTFDQGVGMPPPGIYWAWINRNSGVVEQWDMQLQGMKTDDPPVEVIFHDYRRIAGLLISFRKEVRGKGQTVRLDNLQILPDVPKGAFKD